MQWECLKSHMYKISSTKGCAGIHSQKNHLPFGLSALRFRLLSTPDFALEVS